MRLKPFIHLLWLFLIWVPLSGAETYSAKVPVLNGNVHQARQEALRLIFLEAGQTGDVQVSTNSALVGMELAETVRWRSRFEMNGFKVIHEAVEGDSLALAVEIQKQDRTVETCPAPPLQLRNLEYVWQRSSNKLDMETEILFRLAMKKGIAQAFPFSLVEEAKSGAPYRLVAQLEGSHGFFQRNLKLTMTFIGGDGLPIQQTEFPFSHASLTDVDTQHFGGVTIKNLVLSDKSKQLLVDISRTIAEQFTCFPVVARVPSGAREWVIKPASDMVLDQLPTVIFSRSWPVKAKGQLDLLSLENIVEPKQVSSTRIVFDASVPEGGYLLFQ
ncbi:MAG: hypothetical protein RIR18_2437 [Pseudomonadota bacterium]|jgi:hypothetical protein